MPRWRSRLCKGRNSTLETPRDWARSWRKVFWAPSPTNTNRILLSARKRLAASTTVPRSWAHDMDPAYVTMNLSVHPSSSRTSGMTGGREGPQFGTRWTRSLAIPFETTCRR